MSFFLAICCRGCQSSWHYWQLSVNLTSVPCGLYLVFEDITVIVRFCGSFDIPQVFWAVPCNFAPIHIYVVELNWVVLQWSYRDIDEIPCASSNSSPPGFFKVNEGYILFSSIFNSVGHKHPMFSSCKAHHYGELGLDVTLPLNVSLDLGLRMAHITRLSRDRYTQTLVGHMI